MAQYSVLVNAKQSHHMKLRKFGYQRENQKHKVHTKMRRIILRIKTGEKKPVKNYKLKLYSKELV